MGRNKLARFKQNEINRNVVQEGKDIFTRIKGHWNKEQFQNNQPLVVELACGRGEFTVGMARVIPNQNFIGVDIKGSRIWKGSITALEEDLNNVAFLRSQIETLDDFFDVGEISELWITFPDPRPREGDEKKRLTSPRFLDMYKLMIKKRGIVHLKTDNTGLFDYTLMVLENRRDVKNLEFTHDFYTSAYKNDHFGIQTRYEKMFSEQGKSIKYLKFQFVDL
ncbi:MAG: tRNA (guanosine(46)-N7)-methyltransferase TrmB [Anditalea sp.]